MPFLFTAVQKRCVWVWMAGKCDWNKCGIVRYPNGIPHFHAGSLWRPSAEFNSLLSGRYLQHEWGTIQSPDSTSVFIFPTCRKMEWRKRTEQKIMWNILQQSRGMFDIDLDCAKPNVCVCDKTGVSIISEGTYSTGEWDDLATQSLCFTPLFFLRQNHQHHFLPVPFSHCFLLIL